MPAASPSLRPAKLEGSAGSAHDGAAPPSAEPPGDETQAGQSGHSDLHPADDIRLGSN